MRVLKARDELHLGLEAADELRVVGQRWAHELDSDLAPHLRLGRAVDDAEGALADILEQLEAAQRPAGDLQRRGLLEHLLLEPT